jgi:hypothetical protein
VRRFFIAHYSRIPAIALASAVPDIFVINDGGGA